MTTHMIFLLKKHQQWNFNGSSWSRRSVCNYLPLHWAGVTRDTPLPPPSTQPTCVCPCMAARCSGVYPALDLTFTFTGMAFSLAKASSWESSSALPCLAAQWRQVKPVTKSLLATRLGSTASRGCRLSHRPSEVHSIHSCSSGSRVTEAQSSSVAEERIDVESPSLLTESRRREPRLIRDLRTCKGTNIGMKEVHAFHKHYMHTLSGRPVYKIGQIPGYWAPLFFRVKYQTDVNCIKT